MKGYTKVNFEMNKKIIIISMLMLWSMGENKGAPSFYMTLKKYVDEGFDVTLISPNTDSVRELFDNDFKVITIDLQYDKYRNIKKIGGVSKILQAKRFIKDAYNVAKKFADENCIIYGYEVQGIIAAKKIADRVNAKLITRYQGTIITKEEAKKNAIIDKIKKYPHLQALRIKADMCIMTNDGTFGLDVLKGIGNETKDIFFWRNGLDFDKTKEKVYTKNIKKNVFKFLTVSRVVKWKRIDRAIDLIKILTEKGYNCELKVVGDGSEKENLISQVHEYRLEDKVFFLGAIPHNNVYDVMQEVDFFLSFYDISNLGNPLFEAMYMGLPIITLNTGDTASVIKNGENGILLDIDDLDQEFYKTTYYLDNYSKAIEIGKNGRKYAISNFYSWEERMNMEIECVEEKIGGTKSV